VREELERSYDDLRRELGLERAVFAYPYGGRENMTPDRLQLVRAAGYRACLAAYGGSNVERVDPFEVRRKGIHWEFSDPGFLYAALGIS
jgi:peptidoglycan/xylan/chitin deacetylase (PgdA/CDA1 family)